MLAYKLGGRTIVSRIFWFLSRREKKINNQYQSMLINIRILKLLMKFAEYAVLILEIALRLVAPELMFEIIFGIFYLLFTRICVLLPMVWLLLGESINIEGFLCMLVSTCLYEGEGEL